MYSTGLRVSEAVKLKVSDIDSKNMQLLITDGKRKKDRYAVLSEKCLQALRGYYKLYKPTIFFLKVNALICIFQRKVGPQRTAMSGNRALKARELLGNKSVSGNLLNTLLFPGELIRCHHLFLRTYKHERINTCLS